VKIGHFLASEEYDARELVDQARRAEQAGFLRDRPGLREWAPEVSAFS
jgi:hypothetical protein